MALKNTLSGSVGCWDVNGKVHETVGGLGPQPQAAQDKDADPTREGRPWKGQRLVFISV
jgi:hypothetical protein